MSDKKTAAASFTSDLFGAKDISSSSNSNHIFASIFSSNSFKGSQHSEVNGKSQAFSCSPKTDEGNLKCKEWKKDSTSSKEMSSFNEEQRTLPCHYSSSIYYGGQDVYTQQDPATTRFNFNSVSLKKDGEEDDDSGGASRGNWWQGSLYY